MSASEFQQATETGQVNRKMIESAASARTILDQFKSNAAEWWIQLAKIKGNLDGNAPFNASRLKQMLQSWRANVNHLEARAILKAKSAAYWSLFFDAPTLVRVTLRDAGASADERKNYAEWQGAIEEEYSATLKEWPDFTARTLLQCDQMLRYGPSVVYFPDEWDWRYQVARTARVLMPRNAKNEPETWTIIVIRDEMASSDLFGKYADPDGKEPDKAWQDEMKKSGWILREVREALIRMHRNEHSNREDEYGEGEWLSAQQAYKNNAIGVDESAFGNLQVAHFLWREADGSVTHAVLPEAYSSKDFLFKKEGRYKSMADAVLPLFYEWGDGYFYSVKGLGHEIYPHTELSNRLLNSAHDAAFLSGSMLVRTSDEEALGRVRLVRIGPLTSVVGAEMIPSNAFSAANVEGLISLRAIDAALMNNNFGVYKMRSEKTAASGPEKTAEQVRSEETHEARFEEHQIMLFYRQADRLHANVFKRLTRTDYPSQAGGGEEAAEFMKRCEARGVPRRFLSPDRCHVACARAMGYGSPIVKDRITRDIMGLTSALPEQGRVNAIRDRIAVLAGQQAVDRYLPPASLMNIPTADHSWAALENAAIANGQSVIVGTDQPHPIHVRVHLEPLIQIDRMVRSGQLGMPLPQAALVMKAGAMHVSAHVEAMRRDPSSASLVKEFDQVVESLIKTAMKLDSAAQKQEQEKQKEAAKQQAAPPPDPELALKARKNDQEFELKLKKLESQLELLEAKTAHAMELKERKTEADIAGKKRREEAREG